jgi:hypothetical protein
MPDPGLIQDSRICVHSRYNYQLCTFMVMDEYGNGQVVQHSLLETNSDWHMLKAIDHFIRVNEKTKLLRVVMVDKDLNAIKCFRNEFPEARVLICLFHVVKWLAHASRLPEHGKISSESHKQIDHLVHNMVYAKCEETYDLNHTSLQVMCNRIGFQSFFAYMERNWDNCQDMWVFYRRQKLPHFKNHTNNRLESFFGKVKAVLNSNFAMADCIKEIIASSLRSQREYESHSRIPGFWSNRNYDEEMSLVLRYTNHFVAEEVKPQYVAARAKYGEYIYEVEPYEDAVYVKGKSSTHKVMLIDWRCDCSFAKTMKLPCRHAIAYRIHSRRIGAVIPMCRVDKRYVRRKSAGRVQVQYRTDPGPSGSVPVLIQVCF